MTEKPIIKCCECGNDVERTEEESIEMGLPIYICDRCLATGNYSED
ncbi:MAG: hypothetical protein HZB80_00710 [Deltaproteobacteria bacterium]|nr:hypothetical protein [Deltaproteobacteria bacterium]